MQNSFITYCLNILLVVFIAGIPLLMLFYILSNFRRVLTYIRLKQFSSEFLKLTSNDPKRILKYNEYLMWKSIIHIKHHPDFFPFYQTHFLNDFVTGFKKRCIPSQSLFGFCAILTVNYDKIRSGIVVPAFLSNVESIFRKIFPTCNIIKLKSAFSEAQKIVASHETILELTREELIFVTEFMKLYFLYLYALENPEMAKSLYPQAFYSFPISNDVP